MTGRKQEFNLQVFQIVDALLFAVAFWLAYVIRVKGQEWLPMGDIGAFADNQWIVFVAMPFGPILLEL